MESTITWKAALVYGAMVLCSTAVELPRMFSDHGVLHQGTLVPVWGWGSPGETVTVEFAGQKVAGKADSNGEWRIELKYLTANATGGKMTVTGGSGGMVEVLDLLVGEVWMASGQSNMQRPLAGADHGKEDAAAAGFPGIRMFLAHQKPHDVPQRKVGGSWAVCSPSTAGEFSAVGYHFAQRLHQELGVPIGIIRPVGMIHAWVGYAVKGAIWYQGESNASRAKQYEAIFPQLIEDWRRLWKSDFPFYFVQLANFKEPSTEPGAPDEWAELQNAQRLALALPKTGMAVINDIGMAGDVHPINKRDVGYRLARWALAKDYGKSGFCISGPLYKGSKVEGSAVRIEFDHAKGLKSRDGGPLQRFEIAGEDRKWSWADAVIEGETVVVSNKDIPTPVAVRYAWAANPEGANLVNDDGLPASLFCTDDWRLVTEQQQSK